MPPPGPVLFVTWAGGGNVDPVLGLGARLAAAGRPAAVLAPPELVDRVAAAGLTPLARDVPDPWDPAAMAADVRTAAERVGATAVVVDYMLPGALCGAEAAGLPTAALVHTLYGALLVDGAPGPMAMAASPEGIAAVRARLGLPPVDGFGGLLDRCARVLVTCPRALDRPPDPLPANVRYVGPVPEAAGPDAGWAPPAAAGGRPLVVVSLGTTPMDEAPVLRAVVDSLRAEPVHALVTLPAH
ncbi:MAG TPA: hypothetical protein VF743_00515, partial [Acidimicrobiales bacterium]